MGIVEDKLNNTLIICSNCGANEIFQKLPKELIEKIEENGIGNWVIGFDNKTYCCPECQKEAEGETI